MKQTLIKIWNFLFGNREPKSTPNITYSKPDKDGVVEARVEGSDNVVRLQTFSEKAIRRFHLIADGYSTEEANAIIKREDRDKRLKELLDETKENLPPSE